jgi:hypothetical protein
MLGNGLIELRKTADAQLDSAVDELRQEATTREAEIRSHLGYVLAGSSQERILGVVLLGTGILLGIAANVSGALS